jgi:hypothetical protein
MTECMSSYRVQEHDGGAAKSAKLAAEARPRGGHVCGLCGDAGGDTRSVEGVHVHDSCALWAPNVYEDAKGKMRNVKSEMRRGSKMVGPHRTATPNRNRDGSFRQGSYRPNLSPSPREPHTNRTTA